MNNNNLTGQLLNADADKQNKSAFSKLSTREKTMIIALVIFALVGGLGYFVVMPALDKLSTISEEILELETQQISMQNQIGLKDTFIKQLEEAQTNYEKYQTVFFPQMSPERIDEMITSAIKDCGLQAVSLTMSQIQTETVPTFSAQTLQINSAASAEEDSSEEGAEGEEASEEEMEMEEEYFPGEGPYSFVYTVDINAAGGRENAYALLDTMLATDALRVISYQYTPPQDAINNPGDILSGVATQEATLGAVSMQVKLYAFLPGITPGPDSITSSVQ